MVTALYLTAMAGLLTALFFVYASSERARKRRCGRGRRRAPATGDRLPSLTHHYWSFETPEDEERSTSATVRTPSNSRGWR